MRTEPDEDKTSKSQAISLGLSDHCFGTVPVEQRPGSCPGSQLGLPGWGAGILSIIAQPLIPSECNWERGFLPVGKDVVYPGINMGVMGAVVPHLKEGEPHRGVVCAAIQGPGEWRPGTTLPPQSWTKKGK